MRVYIKLNLRKTSESLMGIKLVTFWLPVRCSNHLSYTDSDGERRSQCVLVRADMCTASAVSTYLGFIYTVLLYLSIIVLPLVDTFS